jgi:hypothetical protein
MRIVLGCVALCLAGAGGCDQETPVCSGTVTADLGMGATPGCEGGWLGGTQQMCPQEMRCGFAVTCMAFEDYRLGECVCPELDAMHSSCCGLSITAPADGTTLTAADDVDAAADGIQLGVTVHGESCWTARHLAPVVHPCDAAADGPRSNWDVSGDATAVVDLGAATGCVHICADILAIGEVAASDSIEVCLPSP